MEDVRELELLTGKRRVLRKNGEGCPLLLLKTLKPFGVIGEAFGCKAAATLEKGVLCESSILEQMRPEPA